MSASEISVLIADDEAPARKRLKSLIEGHSFLKICAEAENGDDVLKEIILQKPQVAFLDINMPGASVFSTIPSLKEPPLIIFQTAYSEYGVEAFEIDAVDYLLKPVSRDRFAKAVEKLLARMDRPAVSLPEAESVTEEQDSNVISVKSGEALRIIQIDSIRRISFEDGFSFLHCGTEKIYSDKPLSHFAELLEKKGFYQVSRSDIINIKTMAKLHPFFNGQYVVELNKGEKVHVSRRRAQKLKEIIKSS